MNENKENSLKFKIDEIIFILLTILITIYVIEGITNKCDTDKDINLELNNYNFDYNWLNEISINNYNLTIYDLNEGQFIKLINDNYVYISKYKDCKYWTKLYNDYYINKGYKTKYILFEDQHIFLIAYSENKYIVADGLNIRTTNLI